MRSRKITLKLLWDSGIASKVVIFYRNSHQSHLTPPNFPRVGGLKYDYTCLLLSRVNAQRIFKKGGVKGTRKKIKLKKQNKTKAKTRKLDGLLAPITPHCLCSRKKQIWFLAHLAGVLGREGNSLLIMSTWRRWFSGRVPWKLSVRKKSFGNRFLFKKWIVLNISFFSPSVAICANKNVTSGTTETAERYFS